MAVAFSACSVPGDNAAQSTNTVVDGPVKIGFSQATQQSPFYVALTDAAKAEAQAQGNEFFYADANGDVTKQNNDVQDLITRGINVLVINPVDPKGVTPSLAAAKAAGIKVVTVDRPVESGAAAFVGRDNKAMGQLVGEAAVDTLGPIGGKIIQIQGDAGGAVARDRRDGFLAGVSAQPNITVVDGPYCDYTRSKAVTAMQDLLQAHPDLKAVYAQNDDMALGALQVLTENHRTDVKVFGVDGLMEAVRAIANGDQYIATALNDPNAEGRLAVETAVKVARGKSVPDFVDAGTSLVNKSNAQSLVSDTTFAAAK
ncbi:substrate-binding domain-containing protein [Mycobacterium sp. CBMA247]|nr:substrate-binding domain-containing protein [Mycolicibacterium sp. CBMA 329]MUL88262.1 substrate-binding domain-containing protein [Mycolicibacterium sp. CBMA 331]MUL99289.1 substrate-binding domain-containing protein [Mycolicibacterium sp. CBMA 334]MUM28112.1 substrate-binding domain-containing protein [Mycolicibacterium sp. CBMA 295]MUM39909.1 substrate-binding domain-containing protein [Mycolicibacterium sp. CBMA 247]MUM44327.1 substrate-binding domain-containing protein [Mycolicibacteri